MRKGPHKVFVEPGGHSAIAGLSAAQSCESVPGGLQQVRGLRSWRTGVARVSILEFRCTHIRDDAEPIPPDARTLAHK